MSGVAANRDRIPLSEGIDLCKETLVESGLLEGSSLAIYFLDWDNFKVYAEDVAASLSAVSRDLLLEFLNARDASGALPAVASKHRRRSSLRRLFWCARTMRLVSSEHDPASDLPLPPRTYARCRPLTDNEIEDCRYAARGFQNSTRYPAIWALAEAGATPRELCRVTRHCVDLDAGCVALIGDKRLSDRIVPLTSWGINALGKRLTAIPKGGSAGVVYNGPGCRGRQATLSDPISRIFMWAGLSEELDIASESIRGWVGAVLFGQTNSHADVARRLGLKSLDKAAEIIGDDWLAYR